MSYLAVNRPLTNDEIYRKAPSVFAETPHDSRSQRYTYIPTINVVDALRGEGFQPFSVSQAMTRDKNKREHAKHLIRFRHPNNIGETEAHEIIMINSHDGTSSYRLMTGMFRFACANGLICGQAFDEVRVRHQGDVIGDVIEGAYEVLDNFESTSNCLEQMKGLTLKEEEKQAFAKAALTLRYDESKHIPIASEQLLTTRRHEDKQSDLWTTFNTVQENVIKGRLLGRTAKGGYSRTREVKGIDQNVKLNRALWVLSEEMIKLKS